MRKRTQSTNTTLLIVTTAPDGAGITDAINRLQRIAQLRRGTGESREGTKGFLGFHWFTGVLRYENGWKSIQSMTGYHRI